MIDMACDGGGEALFSEDHMTANAFGRAAMSRRNIIAGLIVLALTDAKAARAYFTVGLASLIIEDRTLEPPALEGDPFVGHREWDISNLAIEVKGIGAFKATGTVTFTNDGKPEKIVLELQRSGNDWRIADIDWDSGNLRGTFRRKAAYHSEALPR